MIDILRELKNCKYNNLEEYKYKCIELTSEYLNYRTYFKIDENGNIEIRKNNPFILYLTFIDDIEKINSCLKDSFLLNERQIIKKIKRHTNLNIIDLKSNFMKSLYKENFQFSLEFGKELLLRNHTEFFKILYNFCFLDEIKNLKFLYAFSLEKLYNTYGYNDKILFVILNYITKMKSSYYFNFVDNIENKINEDNLLIYNIAKDILIQKDIENKNKILKKIEIECSHKIYLNKYIKEIMENI